MLYKTTIEIDLEPVGSPTVLIVAGPHQEQATINKPVTRTYTIEKPAGPFKLSLEFFGKRDNDPDTAVIIRAVRINGIANPKIAWAGVYYPEYPKPWSSKQENLPLSIPGQTYLGWNGLWELDITLPAFTWLHQTLGLGWIFE